MTPLERIETLLKLAKESPRQKRYVQLAKKISSRTRTRIPRETKRWLCKCDSVLIPGKNCSVRLNKGKLLVICHECGEKHVIPYKKKKRFFKE